jgi:hypothetical protein
VDVRIGVTHAPRELELELAEDTNPEALSAQVAEALGDEDAVLWLTDRRGRRVGVPSRRIAFVEIGSPGDERRVGFGAP